MGTLYLIPTPLGKRKENQTLPRHTLDVARNLRQFIVENIRTAQSFLQWIDHPLKPFEPEFRVLNKKTPQQEIHGFLKLLRMGDVGLMSEAGAPAVADPGSQLIRMAHDAGFPVAPLTGPSSILLALMASGMNGQQFSFHGYLPKQARQKEEAVHRLEVESARTGQTQIFMETPFRNDEMLAMLIKTCKPETRLAIAANLTMPDEELISLPVYKWKKRSTSSFSGRPALFLLNAGK